MISRARRRTLRFGLMTVTGLARRGYFIPMRHAAADTSFAAAPYGALAGHFRAAEPRFREHLTRIDAHADDLAAVVGPAPEPRFDQTWFPRLDAAALVALVRDAAPARIVEVGSGHSTRFMARAIRDGGLTTTLTAIDPQPRASVQGLRITLVKRTVQAAGLGLFADLSSGDLLMIDSSHVLMPGSDVDVVLNHVVPSLPEGVLVAFHDIFLPAPYPPVWPFTVYNEQTGVAPLIGGRAELLFSSAYVVSQMAERFAASWPGRQPLPASARESLLVLKLISPAAGRS